jgi:diacylglycerol kinase
LVRGEVTDGWASLPYRAKTNHPVPAPDLLYSQAMTTPRGFLSREIESFACAFRGIASLLKSEVHARIHLVATVVVLALGWWLEISAGVWIAVVLAIGLVWVAEALNTAIEYVADLAHPDEHPEVKKLKDLAAAAVLFASVAALVVGLLIFLPYACNPAKV